MTIRFVCSSTVGNFTFLNVTEHSVEAIHWWSNYKLNEVAHLVLFALHFPIEVSYDQGIEFYTIR